MAGTKGKSGGARRGSGPARRRFTLTQGTAVMLRELTRSRLRKKDVSEAEITAVLESLIIAAVDMRLNEREQDQ
jgi:hypothetical protein